jgi:hypothetical protein
LPEEANYTEDVVQVKPGHGHPVGFAAIGRPEACPGVEIDRKMAAAAQ